MVLWKLHRVLIIQLNMSSEERALQCLGLGKLCSRRCRVRPVIVMITGRFFAFEGAGSLRITEVAGETCFTSVKSGEVGGVEEQNLRKWEEKPVILP